MILYAKWSYGENMKDINAWTAYTKKQEKEIETLSGVHIVAFQGPKSRAPDDRNVVARKLVLGEQFADFPVYIRDYRTER